MYTLSMVYPEKVVCTFAGAKYSDSEDVSENLSLARHKDQEDLVVMVTKLFFLLIFLDHKSSFSSVIYV